MGDRKRVKQHDQNYYFGRIRPALLFLENDQYCYTGKKGRKAGGWLEDHIN